MERRPRGYDRVSSKFTHIGTREQTQAHLLSDLDRAAAPSGKEDAVTGLDRGRDDDTSLSSGNKVETGGLSA